MNSARLRHASNLALSKHPNLCAAFIRVGGERPVQAIAGEIVVPWKTLDLSMHSGREAELSLQERVFAERDERFQLDKPPLLRLLLVKLPSKTKATLSFGSQLSPSPHGWMVVAAVPRGDLIAYRDEALYGASPVRLTYKNYLTWVRKQSRDAAFAAWGEYLEESRSPRCLALPADAKCPRFGRNAGRPKYRRKPPKKSTPWRTAVA